MQSFRARHHGFAAIGMIWLALLAGKGEVVAQTLVEPIPRPRQAKPKAMPGPETAAPTARPCPEYGPGFIRLPGSAFCVRAGGSVKAEVIRRSRNSSGLGSQGTAYLDARGQSDFGPVRAYVRGRWQSGESGWRGLR